MTTGSDPEPRLEEGEEWISRADAMLEEDISERVLTDRIASGYYRSKKVGKNRLIALKRKITGTQTGTLPATVPEVEPEHSGSNFQSTGIDSGKINALMDRVLEVSKTNMELNTELRKTERELLEKNSQLISLNGERANFKTTIEKRQDDKKRIEALEKENQALKAELEKAKTPWWKKFNP